MQYTFILQTSSDVIDLTCVFYQAIFQHILNGNFDLNKGNRCNRIPSDNNTLGRNYPSVGYV